MVQKLYMMKESKSVMKKYLKNFLRYKFADRVGKEKYQVEVSSFLFGYFMDADRAIAHDACIDVGVWYILW